MAPVRRRWLGLLRAAAGRRPLETAPDCRGLERALAGVDLPPAPDPLVELWHSRMLAHLIRAARNCRQGRFFAATWRLEEAGRALLEISRALAPHRAQPR